MKHTPEQARAHAWLAFLSDVKGRQPRLTRTTIDCPRASLPFAYSIRISLRAHAAKLARSMRAGFAVMRMHSNPRRYALTHSPAMRRACIRAAMLRACGWGVHTTPAPIAPHCAPLVDCEACGGWSEHTRTVTRTCKGTHAPRRSIVLCAPCDEQEQRALALPCEFARARVA